MMKFMLWFSKITNEKQKNTNDSAIRVIFHNFDEISVTMARNTNFVCIQACTHARMFRFSVHRDGCMHFSVYFCRTFCTRFCFHLGNDKRTNNAHGLMEWKKQIDKINNNQWNAKQVLKNQLYYHGFWSDCWLDRCFLYHISFRMNCLVIFVLVINFFFPFVCSFVSFRFDFSVFYPFF